MVRAVAGEIRKRHGPDAKEAKFFFKVRKLN